MKKLVIFDLDGTLLNTLDDLAAAGNHLLRAHGWPEHPAERYKLFVGDGVYKLVERMIPADADHSPGALALLRDEYNAYYSAHNADLTAPYPGVPELLGALEQAGAACAVLSNKPHAFTVELCRSLLGERFAVVHGQREGWPTKPDPAADGGDPGGNGDPRRRHGLRRGQRRGHADGEERRAFCGRGAVGVPVGGGAAGERRGRGRGAPAGPAPVYPLKIF